MKKFKFLCLALIAVFTCVGFTSCSDDDDDDAGSGPVEPNRERKLKTMYYVDNESGFVYYGFSNPQWSGDKLIAFCDGDYRPDNKRTISYSDGNKAFVGGDIEMTLNEKGYALYADYHGWSFAYNENGQLVNWHDDDDYEFCTLTYNADGDIINAESSLYGSKMFEYTNGTVTSPIENKGGIMMMNNWRIMWDFEYYYWFGIYGKATRHLPVKVGNDTYDWTLDGQGYPAKCVVTYAEDADYSEGSDTYYFEWE